MSRAPLGLVGVARAVTVALLAAGLGAGCGGARTTGALVRADRLERELTRGVSTSADVRRLLGGPVGTGSTVLPTDPRPRQAWVYLYTRSGKAEATGTTIRVETERQFLLVLFLEDVLDGFMWYEAAGLTEVKP